MEHLSPMLCTVPAPQNAGEICFFPYERTRLEISQFYHPIYLLRQQNSFPGCKNISSSEERLEKIGRKL